MRNSVSRILAGSDPRGNVDAVRQFAQEALHLGAGAIALLGNLKRKDTTPREYGEILKAVAEPGLPAFYIPGTEDAPFSEFLREAANFEIVYPRLRGIHGTFATELKHYVWSGMGGLIDDNPDRSRDESGTLCYPGWEVEYRLKFLQELKDYQKVFLFTTFPEHKGLHEQGSAVLAEIIKTYNPGLVLVAGERRNVMIGKSLVVGLGNLSQGEFASIDLRKKDVTFGAFAQYVRAA